MSHAAAPIPFFTDPSLMTTSDPLRNAAFNAELDPLTRSCNVVCQSLSQSGGGGELIPIPLIIHSLFRVKPVIGTQSLGTVVWEHVVRMDPNLNLLRRKIRPLCREIE
jgi:hypothetical protein